MGELKRFLAEELCFYQLIMFSCGSVALACLPAVVYKYSM